MKRLTFGSLAFLLLAGCFSVHRPAPNPGLTYIGAKPVILSARVMGNVLVVETKWDKYGPYHFVIDTGSSVTLVSPDLARRYGLQGVSPTDEPKVRVRSSDGGTALLSAVSLQRIRLGKARFEYVPALVYDCSDLSSHFGVPIDGILGFPLFRNAILTLDYPHERVIVRSAIPKEGLPGEAILFNDADKTPLVSIRLGDREFEALIDSGSSSALSLNPAGLSPAFAQGPVEGPTLDTLAGDRRSRVGRLADVVRLGSFDIPRPVTELTDELSSIGGGILSHFSVTFDQGDDEVFFQHDPADDLSIPALRSTGLSFSKTPAYWKVVGVISDSPAVQSGVHTGDLVSRIDGEPVSAWDLARYNRLLITADQIKFTFIEGTAETERSLQVVNLVP